MTFPTSRFMLATAILLAVVCVLPVKSAMVTCYSCTYPGDDKCTDEWPWTNVFSSPASNTCEGKCLKSVTGAGSNKVVVRSCIPVCVEPPDLSLNKFGVDLSTKNKCCDSDYCNSSSTLKASLGLLLAMAVVTGWKIM